MERLPERFDVALASRLALLYGRRSESAAANLRRNISHALRHGDDALDEELLNRFVTRGFASYGQYWAEGAKLPGIEPEKVFARFRIGEGLEHLYDAKAKGLGTIIALPHIGSWEWGGSFLNSLGLGMTAVAEDPFGIGVIGFWPPDPGWDRQSDQGSQTKLLAMAENDDAHYSHAGVGDVYPLTGSIRVYFNAAPGKPLEPWMAEYMRLALSQEGQDLLKSLAAENGYIPLEPAKVKEELAKLK